MDFEALAKELRLRSMIEFYKTRDPKSEYAQHLSARIKEMINRS